MSDPHVSASPQNASIENSIANPAANRAPVTRKNTYNTMFVYTSVLNVTLGALFFGYVMSAFNPIQAFVQPHGFNKPIPRIVITLMTSFVPLGAGLGAMTAGKIASKFGRRKPIMMIDFISIIGTILTLLPSAYSLLIGRLIQGYCVGANSSLVPLYINEVAPIEITGKLGTFNQLLITVGILITPLIGLGMPAGTGDSDPHSKYFLLLLGLAGIPPLVRGLLTFFVFKFETPKYLLNVNNETDALAMLRLLYKGERADEELVILKKQKEIQSRAGKVTLRQIISNKYRKRLFVGIMISILQQLSGVNAIVFFSNSIFSVGSAKGTMLPTIYTIVYAIIQVLGVFIAGFIIERLGRRFMWNAGMLFSAVVLAGFGILAILDPTSPGGKFLIWAYVLGFGLSLGPLPWIYISDILPDIGIGIAALVNWIVVFAIGLIFPTIADGGMGWGFIFFAVCSFLGFIFSLFYVKETGDKTEEQIAAMFGYKGDVGEQGRVENAGTIEKINSDSVINAKQAAMIMRKQDSETVSIKSSTNEDLEAARNVPSSLSTIPTSMANINMNQVSVEVR